MALENCVVAIMIRAICILALAVASIALSANNGNYSVEKVKIVNGTEAPEGKYPSQISLQWMGSHRCGGSILNENWMLLSANCIYGQFPSPWNIYAGSVDLEGNGVQHNISEFIVHPGYNPDFQFINDIALAKMATPLVLNENVQAASLPNQNQDTQTGSLAIVVGWGHPYTGGETMQFLQEVDVSVISDSECGTILTGNPHDSNICAGVPEGGKGHCTGDSGSPLFVNGQQVGIVSWNIKPCTELPYYPGVYTEVSWYIDWINTNIN